MQIIELYINDTKVDLFADESVSITDSIQNVRDISKIFTAFSQQFNLPASKTNNKLFKHYYNYDILNGFDARYKANAEIKLNGVTYKTGKIRLNEVSLKDNIPYSYKVVFFGDTIELKELLAEDKLDRLPIDPSLNFEYTAANVKSRLETNGADIVVPLITHSRRFQIHTTNNKYRSVIGNEKLSYADLKPALRVRKIIEAIETEYDLEFSDDFLNSERFNELYIWLHRNEGYITNADEGGAIKIISNQFANQTSPEENWTRTSGDPDQRPLTLDVGYDFEKAECTLDIDVGVNLTDEYTVLIKDGQDNTIHSETRTGDVSIDFEFLSTDINQVVFDVIISSTNTFTLTQDLRIRHLGAYEDEYGQGSDLNWIELTDTRYNAVSNDLTNEFNVKQQMPKMKVFDFLINLFKMFNLTVYKEDGVLIVKPLDDFYNDGVRYDITEYVDMTQSSVSKLLQFKNIDFRFKSKKTQLVKLSDEVQGNEFSQEGYGNNEWDGGDYKVEVDFEKMMYERLTDVQPDPDVLTPITQGTFLDEKGEPTIGQPLLLYCVTTSTGSYPIEWNEGGADITSYNRPSNLDTNQTCSLNFGLEADEYFREPTGDNLYNKYYNDYVVNLFHPRGRKVKVSAYLPLHIILKYNLNDRFIISGKVYRINTIKTNLLTNKSDLELINDLRDISSIEDSTNPNAERVAQPTVTAKDSSSITLSWTAVSGVTGYKLYVDDVYDQTVLGTGHKFSSLESGITYKLGVQASYTNFDAPITNTIETTD